MGVELPPDMMPTRFTASDALEVAKLFWEEKEVLFWWQLPHCLHDCYLCSRPEPLGIDGSRSVVINHLAWQFSSIGAGAPENNVLPHSV